MKLRELIKEARKYLQPPEEDEDTLDFGPRGKAARDLGPMPKAAPAPCPKDTVRQRKPDGTTACVSLRGVKKS
jgi:hypothetical protein